MGDTNRSADDAYYREAPRRTPIMTNTLRASGHGRPGGTISPKVRQAMGAATSRPVAAPQPPADISVIVQKPVPVAAPAPVTKAPERTMSRLPGEADPANPAVAEDISAIKRTPAITMGSTGISLDVQPVYPATSAAKPAAKTEAKPQVKGKGKGKGKAEVAEVAVVATDAETEVEPVTPAVSAPTATDDDDVDIT